MRYFMDLLDIIPLKEVEQLENVQLPQPKLVTFYKDLEDRIIWIDSEIDEELLEYQKYIIHWNIEDRYLKPEDRRPIRVFVYSYGGDLNATLSFINIVKMSKTPVYTYNMGLQMQAGLLILIQGHKRFTLQNTEALIHEGSGGFGGTADQVISNAEAYKKKLDIVKKFIIDNTKITPQLMKKNSKSEWYLDSKQQITYGIVDSVVEDISEILPYGEDYESSNQETE